MTFMIQNQALSQDETEEANSDTEEIEGQYDTLSIDDFYIDFSAPEITAFSLLDVDKEDIETAGSLKEFLINVEDVISDRGEIRPGLAVEWAPTKSLGDKKANTWGDGWAFALRNWAVSLATATTDSTDLRIGAGLKFNIMDRTNILNNKEFKEAAQKLKASAFEDFKSSVSDPAKIMGDKAVIVFISKFRSLFGPSILEKLDALTDSTNIGNGQRFEEVRAHFKKLDIPEDRVLVKDRIQSILESLKENIPAAELNQKNAEYLEAVNEYSEEMTNIYFFRLPKPNMKFLFTDKLIKLKEEYTKKLWNKPSIQFSGGLSWSSDSARISELEKFNNGGSISAAFPFNPLFWVKDDAKIGFFADAKSWLRKNTRLALSARIQNFMGEDDYASAMLGGRFLIGTDKSRFSIEHARYFYWNEEVENDNRKGSRLSVGVEVKVLDTWLEVAVGGTTNGGIDELKAFPSLGFRRSLSTKRREF